MCFTTSNSAPLDESCFRSPLPLFFTRRFRRDSLTFAADFRGVLIVTRVISSPIRRSTSSDSKLDSHSYEGSSATCPSMGFFSPSTSRDVSSDQHWACLAQLRSAFRFSRPLDALLHSRPFGLVSCRFRPWGSCSQRFPSPGSRHGFFLRRAFPRPLSFRPSVASPWRLFRSITVPRLRSRATRPRIRASRRSVHGGTVLPAIHRPILSQRSLPLRGFLPSSLGDDFASPTLMGFLVVLDRSITTIALQSVKELEGRLASFENCLPPWGLCPESFRTEWLSTSPNPR
jgi:hypothetical protein